MKENSEFIGHNIIFSHVPAPQSKLQLLPVLKKIARGWKWQLVNMLATAGIATLIFISIYLFFIQLAKYGW